MSVRLLFLAAVAAAVSFAYGCGGGGGNGGDDPEDGVATATVEAIDPNRLTALVLHPEDVPIPLNNATFNPGGAGVSYFTFFLEGDFEIHSGVGHFPDPLTLTQSFEYFRRAEASLVGGEQNYDLPGADSAFTYASNSPGHTSVLASVGNYFMQVRLLSRNGTRNAEATDRSALDRYASIVFGRLQAYLADPAAVTPDPRARPYETPAVATPTPETQP
jgi:hypothetical protein